MPICSGLDAGCISSSISFSHSFVPTAEPANNPPLLARQLGTGRGPVIRHCVPDEPQLNDRQRGKNHAGDGRSSRRVEGLLAIRLWSNLVTLNCPGMAFIYWSLSCAARIVLSQDR